MGSTIRKIATRYLQAANEKALKKEMMDLLRAPGSFGVVGASQPMGGAALAKARMEELRRELDGRGLKPKPGKVQWEGKDEDAFLVPGVDPKHLFQLGQRFNQTFVAFRSRDGVVSVYAGRGTPKVWFATNNWPRGQALGTGLSQEGKTVFGLGLPWDGHTVYDLRKVKSL